MCRVLLGAHADLRLVLAIRCCDQFGGPLQAVELLRVFSSLNGLDHDGMTGAELSRMFSADALRRKLTARVSLCDPANTVEEVAEYIMAALPQAADGCISMWEFFNAMQGILQVRLKSPIFRFMLPNHLCLL